MKRLFSAATFTFVFVAFAIAGTPYVKKSKSNVSNNKAAGGAGACQASCRENNQNDPDALAACLRECDVVGPASDGAIAQPGGKTGLGDSATSTARLLPTVNKKTIADSAVPPPAGIAIDEGGTPKPKKPKPTAMEGDPSGGAVPGSVKTASETASPKATGKMASQTANGAGSDSVATKKTSGGKSMSDSTAAPQ